MRHGAPYQQYRAPAAPAVAGEDPRPQNALHVLGLVSDRHDSVPISLRGCWRVMGNRGRLKAPGHMTVNMWGCPSAYRTRWSGSIPAVGYSKGVIYLTP